MGLTGDFAALNELVGQLQDLADDAFRRDLNLQLSEAARTLVAEGFEQGIDPAGRPWLAPRHRQGQPLLDTGRLRNSFGTTSVDAGSFSLGTDVLYAGVHQDGATIHQPARVNAQTRRGQFKSRAAAGKGKAKSTRISFSRAHQVVIPRRQMMPEGELPERWWRVFQSESDAALKGFFGE